ncbi:translation initiation factor SUI1, partial [Oesophagostomum dentatum]
LIPRFLQELHCGKSVRLDPILAQVTRINEESTDWNTLIQKVQSKMTKTFVLRMPDGRELIRKINMPKITFKVETRSGNKKVTLINNLAVFGIEPKRLCHQIQVEAATSATTSNEAVNCEGPQVTVLGNQVTYLGELLMKDYGIDKKYIEGLDLGIKKKRK